MANINFPEMERAILKFWEREDCFGKLREKNKGRPKWSFLDGPITANNPMGVHHAWGRTYKDVFQRYQAMTGHELRYQNGFDCQGLWVEVEVEKELGFKSKRDIEAYGIAPFVEKCKERVLKFAGIQTEQSKRLGYWMDWDNSYYTMSDENNYTIWQFLKKCHERGYLYHGYDSMPWCPRCGTGISQHEISNEERPEVTHTSPTVRFPLRDRPQEYLLAWTTTPWTLTSNVACAVHPALIYVRFRQNGDVYYLIKDHERGEEMHKSKGNAIEFNEAAEKEGADAMRWLYASHNPENDLRFGYSKIHDGRRQFLTLWNVYEFFLTYARVEGFDPGLPQVPVAERADIDRWIVCRLQKLIQSAHLNYGRYSVHLYMRDVVSFIDALSRWYLRRSRRRFWKSKSDGDKLAAYQTLWECLVTLAKLLAPVIPFTTEAMYQQLWLDSAEERATSVHLCDFPQADESVMDARLLRSMDAILDLVGQGHAARKNAGVKVRQPLSEVRVVVAERNLAEHMEPFLPLILDELNVKQVTFVESAAGLYDVSARLDAKAGKPKYGRLFASLQESIASTSAEQIEAQLKSGKKLSLLVGDENVEVSADEIILEKKAREGWALSEGDGFLALVNTHLDAELIREGLVRDLVRHIQTMRKEAGFEVTDRIRVHYEASDQIAEAVSTHSEYLANETLAVEISRGSRPVDLSRTLELGDELIQLSVSGLRITE